MRFNLKLRAQGGERESAFLEEELLKSQRNKEGTLEVEATIYSWQRGFFRRMEAKKVGKVSWEQAVHCLETVG